MMDQPQPEKDQLNAEMFSFFIKDLRWIISHIPRNFTRNLRQPARTRWEWACSWDGDRRETGAFDVRPTLSDAGRHPLVRKGFHSDGGDITVINPWLNFHTMITGRESSFGDGNPLGNQTLHATGDPLAEQRPRTSGLSERTTSDTHRGGQPRRPRRSGPGLFYTFPRMRRYRRIQSRLTIVGSKIVHDPGVLPFRRPEN